MSLNKPPQFVILLTILIPVQCQFEFNNLKAVHGIVVDVVQLAQISCIAILRPNDRNAQQQSAIDRITSHIAKEYDSKYGTRRPTVMSYTSEQYMKFYMDPIRRNRDVCAYGAAIVMVSNSTNEQLSDLSEDSYNFERTLWLLFANGSEYATILQNVHIRISTRLWVANYIGNGLYNLTEIGMSGKDFVSVGNILWSKDRKIINYSKDIHAKMTGLALNVAILYNFPYVAYQRNQSGVISSVTGYYGEVWNNLQETLKFNSIYHVPKDGTYGINIGNGTWTGLYGMIVRNEADVILGAMTISQARYHLVDFLHAIQKTKYKIFYKKDAEIFDWLKVFRPLDYTIWVVLVIWIIAGGTIAYFVALAEKNFLNSDNDISLISCMYFILRTLCNQGFDKVPKSWPLRIFLLTAYLQATVIVTSYSASLISVLTVETPVEPFKKLSDILGTDYKLTVNSISTDFDFFAKATNPIHQKIYDKSIIKTEHFGGYYRAIASACKNYKTGFFGTFTEVAVMYQRIKMPCLLLPLKLEVAPAHKTIAVAKHSQYRELLNSRLFRMIEHGMVNRYRQQYMPNGYETSLENEIGIDLIDIGALFIYLCILQVISFAILCTEHLTTQYYVKKQKAFDPVATYLKQFNKLENLSTPENLKG